MKIKSKNPKVSSMKLCVPLDGVVDIDANGIVDVSTKCAIQLVNGTNDWEYLNKKTVETKSDDDDDDEEEDDVDERKQFEEGLSKMQLADMKTMAKEAEYPEEEWSKLSSKKIMISYLLKKYDEASDVDEEED